MAIQTTYTPEGGTAILCHVWSGFILGRQKVADVYHRLGATGAGVQSLGYRAKPSRCRAVIACADSGTALNVASQFSNSRAGFATIIDDFGFTNRCVVHDADARVFAGAHGYGGVMYPFRVEADLLLEYVGEAGTSATT